MSFRVRQVIFGGLTWKHLDDPAANPPPAPVEVWRVAEDALPMPDGTLICKIDGQELVVHPAEWRETIP